MISSRRCCVLRLRVLGIVRWNYTCPAAHSRAPRCRLPTVRSTRTTAAEASQRDVQLGAPGLTLFENTPIQPKPQPRPGARDGSLTQIGTMGDADMAVTGMARIRQIMFCHDLVPA
jgi:hypothetical protein